MSDLFRRGAGLERSPDVRMHGSFETATDGHPELHQLPSPSIEWPRAGTRLSEVLIGPGNRRIPSAGSRPTSPTR
jgi:hypothetical protein